MEQITVETYHPTMRTLSDDQIHEIHQASLTILEQTGIDLEDPEALDLVTSHGATIGPRKRVHIPTFLVQDALAAAPRQIPMHDRLGQLTMPLALGKVFFGTGSDTIFVLDVETGQRRRAVAKDVHDIARLCDALPNIDFNMSMANPSDVPTSDMYVHEFIQMMRGSTKPVVITANDRRDVEDIWRIAAAVAGGEDRLRQKPFLLCYLEPVSPLRFARDPMQKLLFLAEKRIPLNFAPSPNMGAGGPVTMAGAIALANAECLAGLVLAQLKSRGTPFLYGANVSSLDMRTTVICYGPPEWMLSMAALADMARFYGLPVWGYGGATDAKTPDAQAGLEAALSIYTSFLSRNTLVHDVGYLEMGYTSSMEMIILVDEIIAMVRYIVDGVPVTETSLALDAIDRAQPGSGFLADDHTLENWRHAQFIPRFLNRQRFQGWDAAGRPELFDRLNQAARKILAEHEVPPLPETAEEEIARVLKERDRHHAEEEEG